MRQIANNTGGRRLPGLVYIYPAPHAQVPAHRTTNTAGYGGTSTALQQLRTVASQSGSCFNRDAYSISQWSQAKVHQDGLEMSVDRTQNGSRNHSPNRVKPPHLFSGYTVIYPLISIVPAWPFLATLACCRWLRSTSLFLRTDQAPQQLA